VYGLSSLLPLGVAHVDANATAVQAGVCGIDGLVVLLGELLEVLPGTADSLGSSAGAAGGGSRAGGLNLGSGDDHRSPLLGLWLPSGSVVSLVGALHRVVVLLHGSLQRDDAVAEGG
jgi:hypothetical protein